MTLKAFVDTLDTVPEAARGLYVEKEGKFALAVEGMVPKARLDEFRETNVSLKRQLEETTARYEGIDPEKARELAERAQKERDRKLVDAGRVDELVNERTNAMKGDYEKKLADLTAERDRTTTQLQGLVIDSAIRDHAAKAGVRPTAIEDVLLRGRQIFRLQDGKAVAMDGDKPVFGKTGDAMDIGEWVGSLTENAPHLFNPSQGGGSASASGGAAGAGRVARGDQAGFLTNLDAIAAGKVKVA